MKIGLPRHITVIACPTSISERSTSVVASDSADWSGFMQRPKRDCSAYSGKAAGGNHDDIAARRLLAVWQRASARKSNLGFQAIQKIPTIHASKRVIWGIPDLSSLSHRRPDCEGR